MVWILYVVFSLLFFAGVAMYWFFSTPLKDLPVIEAYGNQKDKRSKKS